MSETPAPESPKRRFWFVVLTWVTLVLFAAFTALITVSVVMVPRIRKGRQTGAVPAIWEARR
jgi:cytoskeletal protein RodZ